MQDEFCVYKTGQPGTPRARALTTRAAVARPSPLPATDALARSLRWSAGGVKPAARSTASTQVATAAWSASAPDGDSNGADDAEPRAPSLSTPRWLRRASSTMVLATIAGSPKLEYKKRKHRRELGILVWGDAKRTSKARNETKSEGPKNLLSVNLRPARPRLRAGSAPCKSGQRLRSKAWPWKPFSRAKCRGRGRARTLNQE